MAMFIKFKKKRMTLPNSSLRESAIDSPVANLVCSILPNGTSPPFISRSSQKRFSRFNFPAASFLPFRRNVRTVARRSISATANAIVKHEILRREWQGGSTRKMLLCSRCFLRIKSKSLLSEEERKCIISSLVYFGTATRLSIRLNFSMAIDVTLK